MSVRIVFLLAAWFGINAAALADMSAHDAAHLQRTAAAHAADTPVASEVALQTPAIPVTETPVQYGTLHGRPLRGYLAQPAEATGSMPTLIVIHEWWGLNENIRATARRLAGEGYMTLSVDLYDGQTATTPKEAMGLMKGLTEHQDDGLANLQAAYDFLVNEMQAASVGSIGWCLGGHWSLETALLLPEKLDAAVIYYGNVTDDKAKLATLQMPLLGLFAEKDVVVKLSTVEQFRSDLKDLNKDAEIIIYPGAQHGFSNPSGVSYDAAAATDSWQRTVNFLKRNLHAQ